MRVDYDSGIVETLEHAGQVYNRVFALPLAFVLLSAAREGSSTGIEAMGLSGIRILVIEDVADIREVFTVLLRSEGADVTAAANGREALEATAHQQFDVILSDLGLPDVPGEALIRQMITRLRGTPRHRTRIIVITGYGEPFLTRARQAGADVVFTKPVEWTRVLDYLEGPGLAASA